MLSPIPYDAVEFPASGLELVILDETQLPLKELFIHLTTAEEVYDAIKKLKVRGAPAIGVAAASGLAMCMNRFPTDSPEEFEKEFTRVKDLLYSSRPTAVNLMWALDRMENLYRTLKGTASLTEIRKALDAEARKIKDEDIRMCEAIAENGITLLKPNCGILTHCNAGHLAVSRFGTALSPIYLAQQRGYAPKVYADETRPLLQGARLTAFELMKAGVDTTLICDNMASLVMRQGRIDAVMVGCDRVAANGDVANKIGTSGLAILAHHYGIPFYVLGPSSTIDENCPTGGDIVIEERPPFEVTDLHYSEPRAPKGVKVFNPAFDVTPASLITALVTEKGVFRQKTSN